MAIKSKVVSWLGVLLSIITELYKRVAKMGGSDEHFHFLATPEAEGLLDDIARLIRWGSEEFGDRAFRVNVDYGEALFDLLGKPAFRGVDKNLRYLAWEPWPGKRAETRVVLFSLAEFEGKSDAEVKQELRQRGYRAANLVELVALTEGRDIRDIYQKTGALPVAGILSLAEGLCPSGAEEDAVYPTLVLMGHEGMSLLLRDVVEEKVRNSLQTFVAAVRDRS